MAPASMGQVVRKGGVHRRRYQYAITRLTQQCNQHGQCGPNTVTYTYLLGLHIDTLCLGRQAAVHQASQLLPQCQPAACVVVRADVGVQLTVQLYFVLPHPPVELVLRHTHQHIPVWIHLTPLIAHRSQVPQKVRCSGLTGTLAT